MVSAADKKILLSLPAEMLDEIDSFVVMEGSNRTKLIRKAISSYIEGCKREEICRQMKEGYISMGEINLEWACTCFDADCQTHLCYEEKLSECES